MNLSLSQKEIGKRVMELRKAKGWSQEELAKHLSIPRSSLAQVELGNRSVDIIELQKLSQLLEFPIQDFFSKAFGAEKEALQEETPVSKTFELRVSVPTLKIAKFKSVLLYILERCAGKPNVGETVIYKLLYFSDFNYYEIYEEHLSGASYRKLPFGPAPKRFDTIVAAMIEKGELQKIKTEYYGKPQTRYLPLAKPDLTLFKASEKEIIDKVIDQMSDWSAAMISDYSHNDKPWRATKMNENIDYELAFYRKPPYSVRVYNDDEN